MRISILGMDYRSAIFAGCLSHRGHRVIGIDTGSYRADWLDCFGECSPEPGLEVLLEHGRQTGLLSRTTDLLTAVRETELTFMDGAAEDGGEQDATNMERLYRRIGEALRAKEGMHRLLVRSNRSRERILATLLPILEKSSGKRLGQGFQLEVSADYLSACSATLQARDQET
ncbi:hypothetical protein [Stutzerimonas tarimensis]|uniref:UDP-glucose/GDP-mannose dehydrogenase N-terminal domain-containing protein n=1 Tax=Stutzerimonas tarimensis TaxID=1507735 RepID=A0ABV7T915_9GAMM